MTTKKAFENQKEKEEKFEGKKPQMVFEIVKQILPERERWRLEVFKIIAQSKEPITSYKIAKKLRKEGLNTGISSVHAFLDILINAGIAERESKWRDMLPRPYKGVQISPMGMKLWNILEVKLSNS